MKKRISGTEARNIYGLTHMDLFSAIENGLPSYDGFGRKISSLSDRHAQVAKAFRDCVYKGITGEDSGEDSAMMVGETSPGKEYIPKDCELMSLDSRLFDAADLVNLFLAPCESSATERCEDAVRCFGLAPAEDDPSPVAEAQDAPVVESPATTTVNAADAYILAIAKETDESRRNKLTAAKMRCEDTTTPAWKIWDQACPNEIHLDKQAKAERVSKACQWIRSNRPDLPSPPSKTA